MWTEREVSETYACLLQPDDLLLFSFISAYDHFEASEDNTWEINLSLGLQPGLSSRGVENGTPRCRTCLLYSLLEYATWTSGLPPNRETPSHYVSTMPLIRVDGPFSLGYPSRPFSVSRFRSACIYGVLSWRVRGRNGWCGSRHLKDERMSTIGLPALIARVLSHFANAMLHGFWVLGSETK